MPIHFKDSSNRISRRTILRSALAGGAAVAIAGFSSPLQTEASLTLFPVGEEHALVPAIRVAKESLEAIEAIEGYTAQFHKVEVVGRTIVDQSMNIKVRHEPFSIYMLFEKPHEGREVIYVDGKNDGLLLAHESGWKSIAGTFRLPPEGKDAMAENRYPITRAGVANLVRAVIEQWEEESNYGETEVKYYREAKIGDLACKVIESSHPKPRKQFKFHKTRLWLDAETQFPVRVEQYGFPARPDDKAPLVERYTFTNIQTDVRLTDRDFDANNPRYSF